MKKKKTILNNKIKSYSALAGSLLTIGGVANAQVVYTDVADYTGINDGDFYSLDLNNDGTGDFNVNLTINTSTATTSNYGNTSVTKLKMVRVANSSSNEVVTASSAAGVLSIAAGIGAGNTWGSGGLMGITLNSSFSFGPWLGATNKYLGLKLRSGGNTYYGWARLDVSSVADKFTIKDYAYELTPDKAIKAGNKGTTTDIDQSPAINSKVFSSEKNITVRLDESVPASISVKNVLGQEVKNSLTLELETLINMSDVQSGIYFVTVLQGAKVSTTKVFIQ